MGSSARMLLAESWKRSKRRGVDPAAASPLVDLQGPDLSAHLAGHRLAEVLPVVEAVLVAGVVSSGHLVAIADEDGRLLWLYGDHGVRERAERMAFVPGAVWSDNVMGANAPGLALRHDLPVRVRGEEHFLAPAHSWSCSAAPVHDPVTGRVIGGIDVTGRDSAASDEVLALVRATALLAEAQLRTTAGGVVVPAGVGDTGPSRRLSVLGSLRPSLDGRVALTRRHAEILVLLAAHPEGVSSGALAELLAEGRLDEVSVRAEVSRLRRVLGADVLRSRPYRLAPGAIATDADEVDALLRANVAAAVGAYRGPLLPTSDAPGVVDLREELHARVRAAVLSGLGAGPAGTGSIGAGSIGAADSLRAWVSGVGHDDDEAWRLLAAAPDATPADRHFATSMRSVVSRGLDATVVQPRAG